MRVCFVSCYPPTHARLSEYAQNLVEAIAARAAISKVYVLSDVVNGASSHEVVGAEGKIEVFRVWRGDNPISILRLIKIILGLKPDIVHFNLHFQSYGNSRLSNFFGFALIGLCRLFKLRTVVLLHNLADRVNFEKLKIKSSFINRVGIFLAMRHAVLSSSLVTPVRWYAEDIQKRFSSKNISYIPHGTVLFNVDRLVHCNKKSDKVVLMFGHMSPFKGLPTLFEAYEQISKETPGIKLVLAGESHPNYPSYLSDLRAVAPKGVEFLGYVPQENVEKVFCGSDVVVLPYATATGTSGVFHLACGFGKPIVASALPEIKELVNEGASALLVPEGDVKSFKKAILDVLYDSDVTEKMCWQNLQFARRECWGSVAKQYERLYFDLLKSKAS